MSRGACCLREIAMACAGGPLRACHDRGAHVAHHMPFRQKPKSFLDATRRDWQFAAFGWLLRNSGGYAKFSETALVLPTEEFFPDRGMKGHAGVTALFRRIRDHAGMADWPCAVEVESEQPRAVPADAQNIRVFTYRRGSLEPVSLVAGFACDLSRFLLETFEEPAPGGETGAQSVGELAAVFMGFGVFMANAAARHARFRLNEGELAHALALFCLLRQLPPESADPHLNPHLRKHVRLAALDLSQYELQFQKLRSTAAVAARDADEKLPTRAK